MATIPQGLVKVPTGSTDASGNIVYDLFQNGVHLTQYPTGVNINDIPVGTAPAGYTSQFKPVAPAPASNLAPAPVTVPGQAPSIAKDNGSPLAPASTNPNPAPAPVAPAVAPASSNVPAGLTKVATGSVGPDGNPVYDLFQNGQHLTQYPAGVNINDIPVGQAPQGFKSQFAPALDATNTGQAIVQNSGTSAVDYLNNLNAYVDRSLGIDTAKANVEAATSAVDTFMSNEKTATQILNEEYAARGITQKESLLTELDKTIQQSTTELKNLPDNVKTSMQDAGISQAQLDRLVAKESLKPTQALNELLQNRNALASEINTAMSFAEKFANTQMADQAAKLSALQWEATSANGTLKDLSAQKQSIITQAVNERKTVMDLALKNPSAGIDTYNDSYDQAAAKVVANPTSTATTFSIQNIGGNEIRFGFDDQGNVVSKIVLGPAGRGGGGGGGTGGTGGNPSTASNWFVNVGGQTVDASKFISASDRNLLVNAGLSIPDAKEIAVAIAGGANLDDIRKQLSGENKDPKMLDTFDSIGGGDFIHKLRVDVGLEQNTTKSNRTP